MSAEFTYRSWEVDHPVTRFWLYRFNWVQIPFLTKIKSKNSMFNSCRHWNSHHLMLNTFFTELISYLDGNFWVRVVGFLNDKGFLLTSAILTVFYTKDTFPKQSRSVPEIVDVSEEDLPACLNDMWHALLLSWYLQVSNVQRRTRI